MKSNFNTRKFKGGAYATVLSAIVIAIIIVINLFFTKLEITVDLTDNGRYSLTKDTVTMLGEISDPLTLYYLETGDNREAMFDKIISQYAKNCKNITIVEKDPIMNPKFALQYTEDQVEEHSIILVNEANGRSRYIPYSDMLIQEYSINYNTYQYESKVTGIDVEGQLNSAIGYVTMDHLPTIYQVSGHGEQEISSTVLSFLTKANIALESITLLTADEIPADCDVLFVQTPQNDFTKEETALLSDYLEQGGKVIFALSYLDSEHPNLMSIVNKFGIELEDGLLFEGDSKYYMQAPYILIPTTTSNEFTKNVHLSKYVVAQTASGMRKSEVTPDNISYQTILTTSSTAYVKPLDFKSFYKEEGDPSGTFYVGLSSKNEENGGQIVCFSGYFIFNESYTESSSFGNVNLLINSVNALADIETTTIAVRTINLDEDTYLTLTDAQMNTIGLVLVILLPLAILITGIVRVVSRRKRA